MAKIAVLGYGTVGSGVVEVLNTNGASIAKRIPAFFQFLQQAAKHVRLQK